MVARLVPVKNHIGVFQAIERLRREGMDITIALAGDGPLRDELAKAARDLGIGDRVVFLGNVREISRLYRAMDIFVLNSHSEGMSNTILEAMASGLPVIATAVGSNPEIVVAERTGTLVAPGDIVALANALAFVVRRPQLQRSYSVAARRRAEEAYSLDRMVRRYEETYERLATHRLRQSAVRASRRLIDLQSVARAE
jgi:glycosyltransferase involved in cell wall biosynthesis